MRKLLFAAVLLIVSSAASFAQQPTGVTVFVCRYCRNTTSEAVISVFQATNATVLQEVDRLVPSPRLARMLRAAGFTQIKQEAFGSHALYPALSFWIPKGKRAGFQKQIAALVSVAYYPARVEINFDEDNSAKTNTRRIATTVPPARRRNE